MGYTEKEVAKFLEEILLEISKTCSRKKKTSPQECIVEIKDRLKLADYIMERKQSKKKKKTKKRKVSSDSEDEIKLETV